MNHLIRSSLVLAAIGVLGTGALAAAPAPHRTLPAPARAAQAADSMTRYRDMAAAALAAFKAGDKAGAKAKSRELEKAWDNEQKALESKSPDVWKAVDDAMDAFIKPLMKGGSPAADSVQAAYDEFIAKLDMAAKS